MRDKISGGSTNPAKNQETCVTLSNGKSYTICSRGQYRAIKIMAKQRLYHLNGTEDNTATEEEVEKKLSIWLEEKCPFAPIDFVLSKMTPSEQEKWKSQYRFGGITTKKFN